MNTRNERDRPVRQAQQGPQGPKDNFNDPDRQNSEQNEEGTQAQDVAEDALHPRSEDETEPGGEAAIADVVPRDVPDLVAKQKEMLRTGRIDMDAFEGEEGMDDEDEE